MLLYPYNIPDLNQKALFELQDDHEYVINNMSDRTYTKNTDRT